MSNEVSMKPRHVVGVFGTPLSDDVNLLPLVFSEKDGCYLADGEMIASDCSPALSGEDDPHNAICKFSSEVGPDDSHLLSIGSDMLEKLPPTAKGRISEAFPIEQEWGRCVTGNLGRLRCVAAETISYLLGKECHLDGNGALCPSLPAAELAMAISGYESIPGWAIAYRLAEESGRPRLLEDFLSLRKKDSQFPEDVGAWLSRAYELWAAELFR